MPTLGSNHLPWCSPSAECHETSQSLCIYKSLFLKLVSQGNHLQYAPNKSKEMRNFTHDNSRSVQHNLNINKKHNSTHISRGYFQGLKNIYRYLLGISSVLRSLTMVSIIKTLAKTNEKWESTKFLMTPVIL